MLNRKQMEHEGLTEQEINDLVEGERYINTEIVPAFLALPAVEAVYGDDVAWNFKDSGTSSGLHQVSMSEWYAHRDLCADLRPARRSFTDAYTGKPARFVVISATPEQWRAIWRKHTYGK